MSERKRISVSGEENEEWNFDRREYHHRRPTADCTPQIQSGKRDDDCDCYKGVDSVGGSEPCRVLRHTYSVNHDVTSGSRPVNRTHGVKRGQLPIG